MKRVIALVLFAATVSCSQIGSTDIPEPYRQKIIAMRSDTVALRHQCADLQKQMSELQAKIQWNQQQIDITANEAMNSLRYSGADWVVNTDKMKIELRKK